MDTLIYFLIWAVVIFLMMRLGGGAHVMGHGHRQAKHDAGDRKDGGDGESLRWVPPDKDIDPVCGKSVGTDWAKPSVHDGSVYYFCSRECREMFEAAPEQYVGTGAEKPRSKLEDLHA